MLIPKAEETLHKVCAASPRWRRRARRRADRRLRLRPRPATLQFVSRPPWIDVINSRYHVGIDGISLPLVALTLLIVPLCIIYSWNHFPEPHNPKAFLILILVLETGMLGTFVAQDLILFFVFFEVVLLPMYFMIGVWGGEQRAVRVDQVLPLHAVRLGADDRQLPGAVLRDRAATPSRCRAGRPGRRVGIAPRAPRC